MSCFLYSPLGFLPLLKRFRSNSVAVSKYAFARLVLKVSSMMFYTVLEKHRVKRLKRISLANYNKLCKTHIAFSPNSTGMTLFCFSCKDSFSFRSPFNHYSLPFLKKLQFDSVAQPVFPGISRVTVSFLLDQSSNWLSCVDLFFQELSLKTNLNFHFATAQLQ